MAQVTALQPYALPGMTRSFAAKDAFVPSSEGLEWTNQESPMHYATPQDRIHYEAEGRLHWAARNEDT